MQCRFVGAALLGILVACGDSGSSGPPAGTPVVASVSVSGPDTVRYGNTAQYTAVVRDSDGVVMSGHAVTWASSTPEALSISADGLASFEGHGTSEISASTDGVTGSVNVAAVGLKFVAVSAGQAVSCGLEEGGIIYCWGSGIGTTDFRPTPLPSAVGFIGLGGTTTTQTCGIAVGGAPYCWSSGIPSATPVGGGVVLASIMAGGSHLCGLTQAGSAYCWGSNSLGQLGTGSPPVDASQPTAVSGGLTFSNLSAGINHTCAITTSNQAYCWGANGHLQLGAAVQPRSDVPIAVTGGLSFSRISSGSQHSCAISLGQLGFCWGEGGSGQLGTGSTADTNAPKPVALNQTITAIAAGAQHTCAIATVGSAYCWGANFSGQLGDGTTAADSVPRLVAGGLSFQTITTGLAQSCGMTTNQVVYCWGSNQFGEVGVPGNSNVTAPVRVFGQQ